MSYTFKIKCFNSIENELFCNLVNNNIDYISKELGFDNIEKQMLSPFKKNDDNNFYIHSSIAYSDKFNSFLKLLFTFLVSHSYNYTHHKIGYFYIENEKIMVTSVDNKKELLSKQKYFAFFENNHIPEELLKNHTLFEKLSKVLLQDLNYKKTLPILQSLNEQIILLKQNQANTINTQILKP